MDNFLKKIYENKIDEDVHSEFVKFSRGVFDNRCLIDAKKQKDKWSVKTGPEFVNFIVRSCLEGVSGDIKVKGVIVSTMDLRKEVDFEIGRVKQFMGIKQMIVDTTVSAGKIINLMNRFPKAFFALSFTTADSDLKIKPKAPKSAKPAATGEKEPKAEFCSIKTSNRALVQNLIFDFPDFDEINIKHTLQINDIILPKGETDPVKLRENAKRKGKIIRRVKIAGKDVVNEMNFEA